MIYILKFLNFGFIQAIGGNPLLIPPQLICDQAGIFRCEKRTLDITEVIP